jgi:signal transduction histidine kinase/HAMP domain-containing protein
LFQRFRNFNLQTKILAWSFIPTALILSAVAITLYLAYQQVTEQYAIDRDVEITRLAASELTADFEDYIDRLWSVSRFKHIQSGTPSEKKAILEAQKLTLIYFDAGVYLLDNQGALVASYPEETGWMGEDWSDKPFFQRLIRSTQPYISDIQAWGPQNQDVIVFSVPVITETGEFKGVVAGMFRLDAQEVSPFFGKILKLRVGQSGSAYIVDGIGRIIYDSNFNYIGEDFTFHPMFSQTLERSLGAQRIRSSDGRQIVVSYAPVPSTNWSMVIEEDWADLVRPSQVYRIFLLGLLAAGFILPSIVVMVGVRRITGPVNNFITAARRIAAGNFDQRIEVQTHDELEVLATQFNTMAGELKASYASLEMRVNERTKELAALNEVASIVSSSLDLMRILPDALAKTIQVMEMEAGAIRRLDEASGVLELLAAQGISDELRHIIQKFPIEESLVRAAVETRNAVVRLVSEYPDSPLRQILERDGIRLVVSIPLISQEKILGAMTVSSSHEKTPSIEVLTVAMAIGHQIGVAMENARLYTQTVDYAREMEAARRSADSANQAKSVFLANMSHELRTPLNAIIGFTRIVRRKADEVLPERQLENLDKVLQSADHLHGLINDVLDIAKIEAGRLDVHVVPFDAASLCQVCLGTIQPLVHPGVILSQDIQPLPPIDSDPDKVKQILLNLLSNAAKFTETGSITLRAFLDGNSLVVQVLDTGIGIPESKLDSIFDQFEQVDASTTRKYGGTGLGLAISRKLAVLLGGELAVQSVLELGSTFTLNIPIHLIPDRIDGSTSEVISETN